MTTREPTYQVVHNDGSVIARGCGLRGAQWLHSQGPNRRIEEEPERWSSHPGHVYRGVLITEPPGRHVRVHFTEATLSYDSGVRLVVDVEEARRCIDRWHGEMRERLPLLTPEWTPIPGEGRLAEDDDE